MFFSINETLLTIMSHWTDVWQYKPSGDGTTSLSTKRVGKGNLANTKITGCPYSQGYVYGYNPDGGYARKQVPSLPILMEISKLVEEMSTETSYTGMDMNTRIGDLIFKFIIDLQYACDVFPEAKNFTEASPENIKKLKMGLKRLKNAPEGLVEKIEKIGMLVTKIEFAH